MGVGDGTLGLAPSEESLDRFTRLFSFSNFMEYNRGVGQVTVSEGYNIRSMDVAMRATLSPNALYRSKENN